MNWSEESDKEKRINGERPLEKNRVAFPSFIALLLTVRIFESSCILQQLFFKGLKYIEGCA